jgi:predicted nucleotidyltransferase
MNSPIILKLNNFFEQAASQYPIEMVFLYGSYVAEHTRADSDIDLAILFSDEIENCEKIFSLLAEITYKLTKELNQEVNIISIDRNFPHPILYYNAIVLGIPVFTKDNDRYLYLKLEAIHQMEDFQIYGTRWQKEITTHIMEELTHVRI